MAGISLNAIVGDNGIITNSMNAKVKNGMAILEEFLQEEYVGNYDKMTEQDIKVKGLRDSYPEYFYDPAEDNYGVEHYVTDSKGHALYLIKKQNLPNEIKESLVGGDAGEGKYSDYASLNDVYGVTFDLKVWYSSGNGELYGITEGELDLDDLRRTVLTGDSDIAKLVSKREDGIVTANDVQEVKRLTINNTVKSLKDLYVLTSLEELTLEGVTLENLDGIENATSLNYVFFKSSKIEDYSSLKKLGKKLKYLYFYDIDDAELDRVCTNIQDGNFEKLEYMAIVGVEHAINSVDKGISNQRTSDKVITNLLPFSKLKGNVVGRVKYLSLQSNSISDTENKDSTKILALENISEFKSLYLLRIERNNLTSLKGLENMANLNYLYCSYNNLGANEEYNPLGDGTDEENGKDEVNDSLVSLKNKTNLLYLNLLGNVNLKWVGYLENDTALKYLYFGNGTDSGSCINMVDTEVGKLRNILKSCGQNKSYPGKYWLSLLDTEDSELEVRLNNQTITLAQFKQLKDYHNIKYLDLKDLKIKISDVDENLIDNSEQNINKVVNDILKYLKNLKYLRLCSSSGTSLQNLSEISFVKGVDSVKSDDDIDLVEFDALGTKVSTRRLDKDNEKTSTYENGLMLFNGYCPSLEILCVDGTYSKLSDIEETIVRVVDDDGRSDSFFYGDGLGPFLTYDKDVMVSLGDCKSLQKVYIHGCKINDEFTLDLSSCASLSKFSWTYNTRKNECNSSG